MLTSNLVLSRTLFVGGVKTTEPELKAFFSQFGGVQSCIVNHDKRHAFLKMITHQDTQTTRQAVWNLPESDYRSLFERVSKLDNKIAKSQTRAANQIAGQLGGRIWPYALCRLQSGMQYRSSRSPDGCRSQVASDCTIGWHWRITHHARHDCRGT